jgi:hypothetical protein
MGALIAGFGLKAVGFLFGTKTGRIILLVIAGLIAFQAYTIHIENKVRHEDAAKLQAATAAEMKRVTGILADTRAEADSLSAQLVATRSTHERLHDTTVRLSAANDSRPCLDAAAVERLRGITGPARSGKPAGK